MSTPLILPGVSTVWKNGKNRKRPSTSTGPPEWFAKALGEARIADSLGITMEEVRILEKRKPWSREHWRLALKVNCRLLWGLAYGYFLLKTQKQAKPASPAPIALLTLNPKLLVRYK